MKNRIQAIMAFLFLFTSLMVAQEKDVIVEKIIEEATEDSHLEELAHELLDVIGPRLVGTPEMKRAHQWAVDTYEDWGIPAEMEKWGEWRGWERGITHIDMIEPRVRT